MNNKIEQLKLENSHLAKLVKDQSSLIGRISSESALKDKELEETFFKENSSQILKFESSMEDEILESKEKVIASLRKALEMKEIQQKLENDSLKEKDEFINLLEKENLFLTKKMGERVD